MYRDLIGDPERFTAGEREWWLQQFFRANGSLKFARLFDANGKFAGEFKSVEEALQAATGCV